jgi:hypothetical protein
MDLTVTSRDDFTPAACANTLILAVKSANRQSRMTIGAASGAAGHYSDFGFRSFV